VIVGRAARKIAFLADLGAIDLNSFGGKTDKIGSGRHLLAPG
jgi:hypothetical protein